MTELTGAGHDAAEDLLVERIRGTGGRVLLSDLTKGLAKEDDVARLIELVNDARKKDRLVLDPDDKDPLILSVG